MIPLAIVSFSKMANSQSVNFQIAGYNGPYEEPKMNNIISLHQACQVTEADDYEKDTLSKAIEHIETIPDYSLQLFWNAAMHNLKRRIELFSIDLFLSSIDQEEAKQYDRDGKTFASRWSKIKDDSIIKGSKDIGLLNEKALHGMAHIQWLRNHCSAAHETDNPVTLKDAQAAALSLAANLFEVPMPDSIAIPSGFFEAMKKGLLSEKEIQNYGIRIKNMPKKESCNLNGFIVSNIRLGISPQYENSLELFPYFWETLSDVLRRDIGKSIMDLNVDPSKDDSPDKGGFKRLLKAIVKVRGAHYLPTSLSEALFRLRIKQLLEAKNTFYGWKGEEAVAKDLISLSSTLPSNEIKKSFFEAYLRVAFGNMWGRSEAYTILKPIIDGLSENEIVNFIESSIKSDYPDLCSALPRKYAKELFDTFKQRMQSETKKLDIENAYDALLSRYK